MLKVLRTALLGASLLVSQFSVAPAQVNAAAPAAVNAATPGFAPGTTTRVSVSSTTAPANGSILLSSISVDGDYVTFASNATNLVPGVNAATFQVYIHRRSTGVTDIVSVGRTSPASQQAVGNTVSEGGDFVAFDSIDPDLVDGDNNNASDIFRREMRTGVTRLVSANAAGEIADRGGTLPRYSGARGISNNGRYIVFSSTSTNLVAGTVNSFQQVYVKDMDTGTVVRASVNGAGLTGNGNTLTASISGNGRAVVMSSAATNFSMDATNGTGQIYVRDLDLGTTTLESVKNDGLPSLQFGSGVPVISGDGRYVAFETQAVLEGDDHDTFTWDVYLRDRIDHTTQLVSRSANTTTFVDSRSPAISDDGSSVAFQSVDGGIVAGDSNGAGDVYLYDRATEGITLVTLNTAGQQATSGGSAPSVSRDGSAVLFASTSSNLVTTPASSGLQLYVRAFTTNTTPIVFAGPDPQTAFTEQLFTRVGHFVDPDIGQTWTGSVDYGDGSPPVPLTISSDKTFVLTHVFHQFASFLVQVTVTDSAGATGHASFLVDVHRTPLIFVPGLLGSELVAKRDGEKTVIDSTGLPRHITYFAGQKIWPNLIDILLTHEDLNILRFDGDHPITNNADDIIPNGKLVTLPTAYGEIQPFFEGHGYRLGVDFFVFAYDWRYPVEAHSIDLDSRIAAILAATGSPALDVVAHSMGTQVVRAFLSGGVNATRLNHVILAGGPSLGTPQGSFSLTNGLCFPVDVDPICRLHPQLSQYLLRTMPGVIEMAVSPGYYDLFDGRDRAHPVAIEERFGPITTQLGDYAYLRDLLVERGVPESLIDDAEAFHADDLTWLTRAPHGVDLVAGTGWCTMGTIIKRSYLAFLPTPQFFTTWDYWNVDGDGTVVRQSASLEDADVGWSRNAGHRVVYRQAPHGGLVSGDGLLAILDLLQGRDVDNGVPHPPFVCFTFSVHSPAEVVLTDSAGRRIGSSDGQTLFREVPTARYERIEDMKVITMNAPGAFTAALRGTADGDATIRIRWIDSGLVTREAVYRHVPTTPRSVGSLSFDTATGALGALSVDTDGDGTADVTVSPDQLDAAAAADETAPNITIASPHAGQAVVGTFGLDWSATDATAGIASSFAMIDRGEPAALTVSAPGSVQLQPGAHVLEVFAEDRAGNPAVASLALTAYAYAWLEPIGDALVFEANEGRTIPGRFRVTTPSGAFVSDSSVRVTIQDSSGNVVVGPLRSAASATEGVAIESSAYHVNIPTRGLGVGMYRIVVSFDSPTLVGEFSVPVRLR